jgi:hypothetical protein
MPTHSLFLITHVAAAIATMSGTLGPSDLCSSSSHAVELESEGAAGHTTAALHTLQLHRMLHTLQLHRMMVMNRTYFTLRMRWK